MLLNWFWAEMFVTAVSKAKKIKCSDLLKSIELIV